MSVPRVCSSHYDVFFLPRVRAECSYYYIYTEILPGTGIISGEHADRIPRCRTTPPPPYPESWGKKIEKGKKKKRSSACLDVSLVPLHFWYCTRCLSCSCMPWNAWWINKRNSNPKYKGFGLGMAQGQGKDPVSGTRKYATAARYIYRSLHRRGCKLKRSSVAGCVSQPFSRVF